MICICGVEQNKKKFSKNFNQWLCPSCRSVHFTATKCSSAAETQQFSYDGDTEKYSEESYLYGSELRWAHSNLLEQEWDGHKVLEIGCHNGFFVKKIIDQGGDAFGFDLNTRALGVGAELFQLGDRLYASLDEAAVNGPFDHILCIDVLEHVDCPEAYLQNLVELLTPNGKISIAGPTRERILHDKSDFPPHHKWWFSRPGLRLMLERCGLDVLSTTIQRDGLLFLRNLLGRILSGQFSREFHGQTSISLPRLQLIGAGVALKTLQTLGTGLFSMLRISYCSSLMIAVKKSKIENAKDFARNI